MRDSGQWSVVERVAPFNPLLLITNHWSLVTERRTMECRLFNERDRELLAEWIGERTGIGFPRELVPATGIAVLEEGRTLALISVYLEKTTAVAVLGFTAANAENTKAESAESLGLGIRTALDYVRSLGVKHCIGVYGNDGLNRLLDRIGFQTADRDVTQKYIYLK